MVLAHVLRIGGPIYRNWLKNHPKMSFSLQNAPKMFWGVIFGETKNPAGAPTPKTELIVVSDVIFWETTKNCGSAHSETQYFWGLKIHKIAENKNKNQVQFWRKKKSLRERPLGDTVLLRSKSPPGVHINTLKPSKSINPPTHVAVERVGYPERHLSTSQHCQQPLYSEATPQYHGATVPKYQDSFAREYLKLTILPPVTEIP